MHENLWVLSSTRSRDSPTSNWLWLFLSQGVVSGWGIQSWLPSWMQQVLEQIIRHFYWLKIGLNDWSNKKKYRKAECVQCRVCFVNVQSSLHENIVLSVCARMCNAAYVMFIMWNSISGLDACYHFQLNVSCGVAVTVRSHQKNKVIFLGKGRGECFWGMGQFLRLSSILGQVFENVLEESWA